MWFSGNWKMYDICFNIESRFGSTLFIGSVENLPHYICVKEFIVFRCAFGSTQNARSNCVLFGFFET